MMFVAAPLLRPTAVFNFCVHLVRSRCLSGALVRVTVPM
ncbi:hypothetical protein PBCVAN69C_533R [Paramecium bursaria Chlorella virus AN69C]|nr:hypothetical protein PBCVAN69C_533R [Paramecium bursaria Chlorella virus AN69C]